MHQLVMENNMKVCEIFQGMQGEGSTVGLNVIFLRLSGCNLTCQYCDSKYNLTEYKEMSILEIAREIIKYDTNNIVITGGEPLLYQKDIKKLYDHLSHDYQFYIETNGTIIPDEFFQAKFNVSPKLSSSGNDIDKRINYEALEYFNRIGGIFKFVIKDFDKDIEEVLFLGKKLKLNKKSIYLMPEGISSFEIIKNSKLVIEKCLEYKFNFSPRMHVMLYDNKRKV